ncbi:uncharacterized protein J4E88_001030 [Alternaria novae-zelandiae]|uniref:uncharacterized protein n=1 Tax=Alternaria novae-zelandiae TaxID=430562 RepID=UPI0020C22946|nr:uncharacterized protein J4E88_001030 [Alternaria novae-zelandiae]KAI4696851.1 hypothetical protein J4E88_001030 [Alternaria novae-zelandiae]
MSSDYGSDIDSDVADAVDEIVSSQQAPPSSAQIPRPALKPLYTNTAPTPPSSHDKPNEITLQQWHQAASTPPPSASSSDAEPYRLTFGKHEGKTLAEIPTSYVTWLIRNPISSRPMELIYALEEWQEEKKNGRKAASQASQSQASQVSMSSQSQATTSKMPLSPPSSQAYPAPPPSSQPVLSSSHVSKYTSPPSPSRSPSPPPSTQQSYPPSSQPTAPQEPPGAPLYVLPFGEYKGKTLLEVPEDYLYYLGASEDKLATLPGLSDALGLMQKGLPPVAMAPSVPSQASSQALPPPSSAPFSYMDSAPPASSQVSVASQQAPLPPSTAPSHYSLCKNDVPSSSQPPAPQLSASQPTPQPPSSQPPPRKQPYRFDFGKHEGKTIAEVPPDYMAFLKSKGFTDTNETLAAGVAEYERHHPPIGTPRKGEYRFTFGKHEGKTVAEVPSQYIWWLKTQTSIPKDKPELGAAIRQLERTQKRTQTKTQNRSRRRAWSPMCPCCD